MPYPQPAKLYQPLNFCAYCGSTDSLSTEHIIPFGLGGKLILPKASCEECRKATSKVEDFVLRKYLCPLRSYLSLPSRKPAHRPTSYKLTLQRGTHRWSQKVKLAEHPGHIQFAMFDPPGRVAGREKEQPTYNVRLIGADIFPNTAARLVRLGADRAIDQVTIKAMDIARMVAKIGFSYAIAELGRDAFEELYVQHLIRDAAPDWNYWIGGYDCGEDVEPAALHNLRLLHRGDELSAIVHLFVPYCPRFAYEVIIGRLKTRDSDPLG